MNHSPWRFCVAPMMQHTDRHFRYLARIMSQRARLYTEMIVCDALLRNRPERFLAHSDFEKPVALQLGGCDPKKLSDAAKLGEQAGFCEINLNLGCPSTRVKSGRFGATLMGEPQLVSDCLTAMSSAVEIPVTIKTRIGIEQNDSYEELFKFVEGIDGSGTKAIIVHARKAWLDGYSPRENRELPPLRYDLVHQLKHDFPHLTVVLNGGLSSRNDIKHHLKHVDGVMLGRAAYKTPFMLATVDNAFFQSGANGLVDRFDILHQYIEYARVQIDAGTYTRHIAKPLYYFFRGQPGARQWRRHLSEHCTRSSADIDSLQTALKWIERAV